MPPKKASKKTAGAHRDTNSPEDAQHSKDETIVDESKDSSSKKRKAQDGALKKPAKASRRSSRGAASQPIDHVKLINFLLSPEAVPLCRPKDETSDLEARGKDTRAYSISAFTPFEELECALILSRPIGHMLGLRSIRTLFNDPHNLTSPKAIKAAGKDGCRIALDEARTQHRQKTAEELYLLAEAATKSLGNGEDDTDLQRLREESKHDVEKERELLKKNVKGMAKTGIDIFGRRIQAVWEEWYPFADERTSHALEALGLDSEVQVLVKLIEDNWQSIRTSDFHGDEKAKKRKAFVRLLERAVGAELEGNVDEVKKAIS